MRLVLEDEVASSVLTAVIAIATAQDNAKLLSTMDVGWHLFSRLDPQQTGTISVDAMVDAVLIYLRLCRLSWVGGYFRGVAFVGAVFEHAFFRTYSSLF